MELRASEALSISATIAAAASVAVIEMADISLDISNSFS
jgi:hypothetical protein